MKFIKALFLFGFIVLHHKVYNTEIWLNTEYIVSVGNSVTGVGVRTVGQQEAFIVKESFDTITNMIAESKK